MLKAGSLDRRIALYEKVIEKDEAGQSKEKYREYHSCYANVASAASSKEGFEGDQLTAITFKFFTIRYTAGVLETMLIRYEGSFYNIHGQPIEIGRREGLKILAKRQEQQAHIELI